MHFQLNSSDFSRLTKLGFWLHTWNIFSKAKFEKLIMRFFFFGDFGAETLGGVSGGFFEEGDQLQWRFRWLIYNYLYISYADITIQSRWLFPMNSHSDGLRYFKKRSCPTKKRVFSNIFIYPVILGSKRSPGMIYFPTTWGAVQNPRILKITG